MKKWTVKKVNAPTTDIENHYHFTKVFAQVLLNKGFKSFKEIDEYLFAYKSKLADPELMKDLKESAEFIRKKINEGSKFAVIGDYDVDGIMSTYILCATLRSCGADVEYRIPHRVNDGYGIRDYIADEMKEKGCDVIITCDNGISAEDAIKHAKELGMSVVITDHHIVPVKNGAEILPPADYIIDPKRKDCNYPFKELCGAAVAYILANEITAGKRKYHDLMKQLIVYASIATVCDVVPLRGENRIITSYGLNLIKNVDNKGLEALIKLCDFKRDINSYDYGFRIGPCINAAGRLKSASMVMEMLESTSDKEAADKAKELFELNNLRKEKTADAEKMAEEYIEKNNLESQKVFCIYLNECEESIAGIVAGHIKEKYYRPVYVIVNSKDKLKGSGRSITGYHMQNALNELSDLLIEYGGHALAAGFSLKPENFDEFNNALLENCKLTDDDLVEKVQLDLELPLGDVDEKLINELSLLEPFGEANKAPKFAKRNILFKRVFLRGLEKNVGSFTVYDENYKYTMVDFDVEKGTKKAIIEKYDEQSWESLISGNEDGISMNVIYSPNINDYNNTIQFVIKDIR